MIWDHEMATGQQAAPSASAATSWHLKNLAKRLNSCWGRKRRVVRQCVQAEKENASKTTTTWLSLVANIFWKYIHFLIPIHLDPHIYV